MFKWFKNLFYGDFEPSVVETIRKANKKEKSKSSSSSSYDFTTSTSSIVASSGFSDSCSGGFSGGGDCGVGF